MSSHALCSERNARFECSTVVQLNYRPEDFETIEVYQMKVIDFLGHTEIVMHACPAHLPSRCQAEIEKLCIERDDEGRSFFRCYGQQRVGTWRGRWEWENPFYRSTDGDEEHYPAVNPSPEFELYRRARYIPGVGCRLGPAPYTPNPMIEIYRGHDEDYRCDAFSDDPDSEDRGSGASVARGGGGGGEGSSRGSEGGGWGGPTPYFGPGDSERSSEPPADTPSEDPGRSGGDPSPPDDDDGEQPPPHLTM
ncbi:MAG: hypothetical protein AAGF12_28180 [Myxococcota bacterium]